VKRHDVADGVEPRNVERRTLERDQLMRGERKGEASTELARGAGDKYFHRCSFCHT